ncbi:hypothetical protein CYMTET_10917 [Cymbomonas tetramitiformis]|uniref:Uncharacterized protein n=1 Tax=Cymbomonas tetramitiformis TaxID=36881 RepID=A0AAE0LDZ8_9CHLO|nr:hypothetical protein CYMTET_10917 [Cymbomonas tetramitiformis]
MAKLQGTVNWFNGTKGFGFITRDDNQGDVFVHQSDLHAEGFRSLQEGEQVEFTVETGEDGRAKAVDVTGPSGAFVQGTPKPGSLSRGGRGGKGGRSRSRGGAGGRGKGGGELTEGASSGLQVVVHNLPWSATGEALAAHFAPAGNISLAEIAKDNSNRSRGFGIVKFATVEEASSAIERFNGSTFEDREILVRLDRYA